MKHTFFMSDEQVKRAVQLQKNILALQMLIRKSEAALEQSNLGEAKVGGLLPVQIGMLESLRQRLRQALDFRDGWPVPEYTTPETEAIDVGVDMLALTVPLPVIEFDQTPFRQKFRKPENINEKKSYLVGETHWGDFHFELSRYPSPKSSGSATHGLSAHTTMKIYDLKIRFNPSTVVHGHNVEVADADAVEESLRRLQQMVNGFGLKLDVSLLTMVEVHLTRDVIFFCSVSSQSLELEREAEAHLVQELLRLLSWSAARYDKLGKSFDNAGKKALEDEIMEEGCRRGNGSWEMIVYDKLIEFEQRLARGGSGLSKKLGAQEIKELRDMLKRGRIARIEWKLKNDDQIQERLTWSTLTRPLTVKTPADLLHLLRNNNTLLEECFDLHLRNIYLRTADPYSRQQPRIAKEFISALSDWFQTPEEQALRANLQIRVIRRKEVRLLIQVLDRADADNVRAAMRSAFNMGDHPSKQQRKRFDNCRDILLRLRYHAGWCAGCTYGEKQYEIIGRLCRIKRE